MDRNDSEPNRPSLFKAVRAQSAPVDIPPRILADTRKDAISPRTISVEEDSSGSSKYLWLTLLAALVLGAVGLVLLLADAPAPPAQEKEATVTRAIAVAPPFDDAFRAPSTAAPISERAEYDDPLEMLTKNADQIIPYPTEPIPDESFTDADTIPAAVNLSTSTQNPNNDNSPADTDSQSDLLNSLLTNIKGSQAQAVASKGKVDVQVTPSPGTESERDALIPSIQRSDELQATLRDCPSTDTEKGIECRKNVCATHTGDNSACQKP